MFGAALLWSLAARAEEPAPVMELDSLFVPPFRAEESLATDAARLHAALLGALASDWEITKVEDAPPFQDYDARVYLEACPPGRYPGCAMVVGMRAEVDWAIAGELTTDDTGERLQVTFIDVRDTREVFSIGLAVGAGRDDAVMHSIGVLLGKVVHGAFEQTDIRELPSTDPAAAAQMEKWRADVIASSLDEMTRDLGDVAVSPVQPLEEVKLAPEDLERWRNAEGVSPWEQLDLTESAYIRLKNSGLDLETWRRRVAGRAGMVLLRAEVGGGTGPYGEAFQGWVALASPTTVARVVEYHETVAAGGVVAGGELAIGVLPFLEVGGGAWVHPAQFSWRVDQDLETDPAQIPTGTSTQPLTTASFGFGTTFAPLPGRAARPTAGLGLAFWTGEGFSPPDERMRAMPAPSLVLLEPSVGGEARAGDHATVSLRAMLDAPVGGHSRAEFVDGATTLQDPFQPFGHPGVGFSVRAGVQARIGPLWKWR